MSPAEAMRISPPRARGAVSVTERILPPLRAMPARWRMTLRGVTRNRRRTLLTISGVVHLGVPGDGVRRDARHRSKRHRPPVRGHRVAGRPSDHRTRLRRRGGRRIARRSARQRCGVVHPPRRDPGSAQPPLRHAADRLPTGHRDAPVQHRRRRAGTCRQTVCCSAKGSVRHSGLSVGDVVTISDPRSGVHIEQPVAGFVDEPMSPVGYINAQQLTGRVSAIGASCSNSRRACRKPKWLKQLPRCPAWQPTRPPTRWPA